VRENLYRKLAVYGVGGRMVPALCAHQGHWKAKLGESGIAGGELYDDEYRLVSENAFGEAIRPAFDLGAMEYGRADFGLLQGRPQVYEINTNPMIRNLKAQVSGAAEGLRGGHVRPGGCIRAHRRPRIRSTLQAGRQRVDQGTAA
jgi:hypothetical protein